MGVAAVEGDLETIRAYFDDDSDGARDVNDLCEDFGMTPDAAGGEMVLTLGNVEVARYLLVARCVD